ncbi:MAG: GTP cyclohydrolase I [Anaerolineales bacterium]
MEANHEHGDDELNEVVDLVKRTIPEDQKRKFEGYAAEILAALGMELNTPSTTDTPRRFIQAVIDATEGYDGDPKLLKTFQTECRGEPDCSRGQVIEGPIHFFSLCEHHAFPFFGDAYIGYIPHENIIGISKLTRPLHLFAKRFAVQERITQQVADTLEGMLHPHGAAVYLEAHHLCVEMRGVREVAPTTRTTVWRGHYASDASLRAEFFTSCGLKR